MSSLSFVDALLLASLTYDCASRAVPYRCSNFTLVFYVNLMQMGSTLPSADVTYNIQHKLFTTKILAPDYNVKAWADQLGGLLIDLATVPTLPDSTYFASVCFKALLAVPIFSFQTKIHHLQHDWDFAHATQGEFMRSCFPYNSLQVHKLQEIDESSVALKVRFNVLLPPKKPNQSAISSQSI